MPLALVLIVLLIVVVLLYRNWQQAARGPASVSAGELPSCDLVLAYLANGNVFFEAPGREPGRQIHSPYIQEAQDRIEKSRALHGWKQNTAFGFSANGGSRDFEPAGAGIVATSVLFGGERRLLYFLRDDSVGGLFAQNLDTQTEERLLLKSGLALADLQFDAACEKILCSSQARNGTAAIALLDADGGNYREVTGGDTFDSAPTWVPGWNNKILFQSAGLARAPDGMVIAQGNASIQMLDLDTGTLTTVLENGAFDYLSPKVSPQGNLHFIRRPYEAAQPTPGQMLEDVLFFPFRLLRAVFHYLNFFSLMYTRKPLTTASGPSLRADIKDILLKGKRINAEKALREERYVNGVPSLVPHSWQLVCRDTAGNESVLASNVLSFDITRRGDIVYSNGRGVFLLDAGRGSRLLLRSDLIGELAAAPPGCAGCCVVRLQRDIPPEQQHHPGAKSEQHDVAQVALAGTAIHAPGVIGEGVRKSPDEMQQGQKSFDHEVAPGKTHEGKYGG